MNLMGWKNLSRFPHVNKNPENPSFINFILTNSPVSFQSSGAIETELPDYHKMTRSSHRRCSIKKVFLKISQNSQKNACAGFSFLIKLQIWELQLYSKRDSGTGVSLWILWNFEEHLFYRTPHENNFSKVKS